MPFFVSPRYTKSNSTLLASNTLLHYNRSFIFSLNRSKMGKAQSKGSAEITTEPSAEIQEGSGKLKKLDDTYFKENESSVSVIAKRSA
jgi:hypothetical protein